MLTFCVFLPGSNKALFHPTLTHYELDQIDLAGFKNDAWSYVQIGLGRHKDQIDVGLFMIVHFQSRNKVVQKNRFIVLTQKLVFLKISFATFMIIVEMNLMKTMTVLTDIEKI